MKNKRRLIVNADDFGLTKSVSEGIIYAYEKGIVTSTTAMMNQKHTEYSLELAKLVPELEVGVHLVFNSGRPILDMNKVSSFVSTEGYFFKNIYEFKENVICEQLFEEFCAQVNKFIKVYGRKPGHIDCHHWVILYPRFFQCYLEVAKFYDVPLRKPFIDLENFTDTDLNDLMGNVYGKGLENNFSDLDLKLKLENLKSPDYFRASFFKKQATKNYIEKIIREAPIGITELMTHPGFVDNELIRNSSYNSIRESELKILTGTSIKSLLNECNIELVNFGDL